MFDIFQVSVVEATGPVNIQKKINTVCDHLARTDMVVINVDLIPVEVIGGATKYCALIKYSPKNYDLMLMSTNQKTREEAEFGITEKMRDMAVDPAEEFNFALDAVDHSLVATVKMDERIDLNIAMVLEYHEIALDNQTFYAECLLYRNSTLLGVKDGYRYHHCVEEGFVLKEAIDEDSANEEISD